MLILPFTKSSKEESKRLESFYHDESIQESFWGFESLQQSLKRPETHLFRALDNGQLAGFYVILDQVDQVELLYIYVASSHRGKGIAAKLLSHLKSNFMINTGSRINIEVRITNHQAIKAYKNAGFKLVSKRARYYKDGEDALILTIEKR